MNRWTKDADQRCEDYFYEALAFSRHNVDLVFDEENMKPENSQRRPQTQALIQVPWKWIKIYLEPTREEDDPHFPSSSRVSDALTGADKASYQVREPIENDEERLAIEERWHASTSAWASY